MTGIRLDARVHVVTDDVPSTKNLVKCVEKAELAIDEAGRVKDADGAVIPGLFAAGDVVLGLDQISNAMGQAGVAATKIRNLLDERRPIRR